MRLLSFPRSGRLRRNSRDALTLIEVLVALGLLTLVACFILSLFPRMIICSEPATLSTCMANLTGISRASLMYAADDADELMIPLPAPPAVDDGPGVFEWGGKAGVGLPRIRGRPESSYWGTAEFRGPAHRPLNRYIYKSGFVDFNPAGGSPNPGEDWSNYKKDAQLDLYIYRCPQDKGHAGGGFFYASPNPKDTEWDFKESKLSAYDFYGNSYAANCFWTAFCGMGEPTRSSYSPYMQAVSQIPSPSMTIAYMETPARWAWTWGGYAEPGWQSCPQPDTDTGQFKRIPGWHDRPFQFVVAFADGHAATVDMKGCTKPPPNLGIENYPPKLGCEADPYAYYRRVTVRGPGWKLDTLPAPPVPTPWR